MPLREKSDIVFNPSATSLAEAENLDADKAASITPSEILAIFIDLTASETSSKLFIKAAIALKSVIPSNLCAPCLITSDKFDVLSDLVYNIRNSFYLLH